MLKPLRLSIGPLERGVSRRSILDQDESEQIERLFAGLASATRLRLLHALIRYSDPCVGDLAEAVGMKPQAVSNQLRKLVDMGIVRARRRGNHVHYRLEHPAVKALLVHALELSRRMGVPRKNP